MRRHPIQPLYTDEHGTVRFRRNAIVCYLVDALPDGLNAIAGLGFSREDQEQIAQLLGYSLGGFEDLPCASAETRAVARLMAERGTTEDEVRMEYLAGELEALRDALREPMARLFSIHPDDLGGDDE